MSGFGSRISGFFGVSSGGSPTPITNTLQTAVDTSPQGLANKGFYVVNPSNSGIYCGNIDDLVDSSKLIEVANNVVNFISDYGIASSVGQLNKLYNGGANDRLLIDANKINYIDLISGDKNTIAIGNGGNNTVYMQPTTGSQYWLVQQPVVTLYNLSSSSVTIDTTIQQNFQIRAAKNNCDIYLGGNVVNYSITRFAIEPITDASAILSFLPALGFQVLGTSSFDNTSNYFNGGLISVIRVDSTFIMSTFQ